MEDYTDATCGDRLAEVYDDWYDEDPRFSDLDEATAFLAELAQGGPALELGVGTGRVAIPLAVRGVNVHGIDASPGMLDRLGSKPGGDAVQGHLASFADFDLGQRFPLIYVVFNTLFALLTVDEQRSAFRAVARHLEPGGAFVCEAFVPDLDRFTRGQNIQAIGVGTEGARLEVSMRCEDDPNRVDAVYLVIRDEELPRTYPVSIRFVWPEELDAMAADAGLRLRERWTDWTREPFTEDSGGHISVWEPVA